MSETVTHSLQARFRIAGAPMMLRHDLYEGQDTFEPCSRLHYRSPVSLALGLLWVRPQTVLDNLWHKPLRGMEDLEIGDADFDRAFVISGNAATADRALEDEHRVALRVLRSQDARLSLSISGGVACLDLSTVGVQESIDLVAPLLAHLHSLEGGRLLLRDER